MASFEINGKDYELEFTLGAFREQSRDIKRNKLEGIDASMSLIISARKFALKREGEEFTKTQKADLENDLEMASMAEITAINEAVLAEASSEEEKGEDPN